MTQPLSFVFFGLSITSSWGNGHATTYRGLVRELARRGHEVLFLERDVPYYATNRDMPQPPYGGTVLYGSLDELRDRYAQQVRSADVVIIGSYVPEGARLYDWVRLVASGVVAFYDIDTPVTLRGLDSGGTAYIEARQVRGYDAYLSFTGGPLLARLSRDYGAQNVGALYCSADPESHFPSASHPAWDLGYLGTYSPDRQIALEQLLISTARVWREGRFVVAGPQYPVELEWPSNVARTAHVSPGAHPGFYASQRYTLNLTRQDMRIAGYSPSVRLFEAALCGVPVISDVWPGVEHFFEPDEEILLASSTDDVLRILRELPEHEREQIAWRSRRRVLKEHTAAHRAETLEARMRERLDALSRSRKHKRRPAAPLESRGQS